MSLSPACRAKLLEAGSWMCSDGTTVKLRDMPDGHLVNALLKLLSDGAGDPLNGGYSYTQYNKVANILAREVERPRAEVVSLGSRVFTRRRLRRYGPIRTADVPGSAIARA